MKQVVIHAMGLGLIALAAATSADIAEGRLPGPVQGVSAACDSAGPTPRGAPPTRRTPAP